jgi:phenylacetate-CoA ligase
MRSQLPGIVWPAFPEPGTATLLALAWQLDRSQWWSADRLEAAQQRQLAALLDHAATTTPFYQARLAAIGGVTADDLAPDRFEATWARVPVVSRAELIAAGDDLLSRRYPGAHGRVHEVTTSRSTGAPVRLRATDVTAALWNAITLRDHAWHRRDLDGHLAAIRHTADAPPPDGRRGRGWGPATAALAPDAPMSLLSIGATIAQQVDWLVRTDPAYLLVYPSALDGIVRELRARGLTLPSLRQVRTIGETLAPATRALVADVLGVAVVDTYSAQEVGYIALQCPDHPHYHVQAERLRVELLDDAGAPCQPGELGRVVVTDLHNLASPVIRYDLGDRAVAGPPCPCGRGLPVLARVAGRSRGLLRYRDGRTAWPLFTIACRAAATYTELQLVQDDLDHLRLRVVAPAPLTDDERAALIAALWRALDHRFAITVEQVDALVRGPTGKLEEFVSHVGA